MDSLEDMTPEKWQELKARERARDRQRIASGEATAAEIQKENTIFSQAYFRRAKLDYSDHFKALEKEYSDEEIDRLCEPASKT